MRRGDAARLDPLLGPRASNWVEPPEPNRVGNTTGGSWHGVVLAGSTNQEAAYSFLSLMAIKPVSLWAVQHGWTGINPGFSYQMLPPAARRGWPTTSRRAGTGPTSRTISRAFDATFNAPTMLPYLRIQRHSRVLVGRSTRELAAALGGRKTAKEALDAAAAAWDGITDRLGREQQRERIRRPSATMPGRS